MAAQYCLTRDAVMFIHSLGGSGDEQRFVGIGLGSAGELLVVVYAEREHAYRLISARRPTRKERKQYEG